MIDMCKDRIIKQKLFVFSICFLIATSGIYCFTLNLDKARRLVYKSEESIDNESVPETSIHSEWEDVITNIGEDVGRDITTDSQGYFYITGKAYSQSKDAFEIVVAKYNKTGNQEWKTTWGNDSDNVGYGIALDNSLNIYVVGYSKVSEADVDVILVKFDNDGNYIWNRTWGGSEWDVGYSLEIDGSNNIYIAGYTESYGTLGDMLLLIYNIEGNLDSYYTWGSGDTEYAYDLAIAQSGNVYLTGYTSSYGPGISSILLLKFNTTQEFEFAQFWGSSDANTGESVVLDSSEDIYVAGTTKDHAEGSGGKDMVLLKYNSSGILKNYVLFGGTEYDCAYEIEIDSKNNFYISGYTKSYGGTDKDACITKFNSTLDFQWYKLYKGDQNYDSVAYGIAVDSEDNLAITGVSNNDAFVSMYSQLPSEFTLACDKTNPIPDGSFNLSWSEALDAQNYSLYRYDNPITQINDSLDEIIRGNTNRTYSFNNYAEGTYYFIAVAFNRYGNTSSNCIQVVVQSVPGEFTLFEHTEDPDNDGSVNLTWTESIGADNYSIYRYNGQGEFSTLETGPDWTLIDDGITDLYYEIQDLGNGDHNFSICAINEAGERLSNAIEVIVRRAPDSFTLYSDAGSPDDDGKY